MSWRAQIDDKGVITRYKDSDSNVVISAQEFERRTQMQSMNGGMMSGMSPGMSATPAMPGQSPMPGAYPIQGAYPAPQTQAPVFPSALPIRSAAQPMQQSMPYQGMPSGIPSGSAALPAQPMSAQPQGAMPNMVPNASPLVQPGATLLNGSGANSADLLSQPIVTTPQNSPGAPMGQSEGMAMQGKNLRLEGLPHPQPAQPHGYKTHGFLDATSVAILLPTLVLLALIIAAAHKKRLFPWQTIRTFNPPSGLMTPRDYERSYLCPPNLRRHGRLGKRNPNATWTEADGVVIPFGFLARTHLPVTIPIGRLPNKNMFLVAPSGSGKTTLMRAIIKALLAKPSVIIALEAKANDPHLDEKKEGFKFTVLPEAQHAGFDCLYFNPLDQDSINWNPLDLDPISFASSIVQDINSLDAEEQHWAERDHGYIFGLAQLLKWGAVQVAGEDENGNPADVQTLPCNPRGLMRLVNNRRNIVESLRRLKGNSEVDAAELSELTQTLSSIIRTDTDWDKNIQGIRGRLRMFKNPNVLRVTEQSNIDLQQAMTHPTVLIFGAPASLGPDAESLAGCFVHQLQQALHTRYGSKTVLPLFAFFDEYQTLNIDLAGRLSAIVRGANGGLTVILQNVTQITSGSSGDPTVGSSGAELKTIFSNSAIRVCLHNADETTAKFFSEEIGKHAVVVPGISDHYMATGFGIFPTSWNRIHSQQVVARVDPDAIKRMEKHHALVYLSPAGDPEFGEVKPLMVDLRGIEEIARLHLLHNVSARQETEGAMPYAEGQPPSHSAAELAAATIGQAQHIAAAAAQAMPAQALVPPQGPITKAGRNCPHCMKPAGKGKFCIDCGQFLGGAQDTQAQPQTQPQAELSTSAEVLGQPAYAYTITQPQMPQPMPVMPQGNAAGPQFPSFAAVNQNELPQVQASRRQAMIDSPQQIAQTAQDVYGGNPYQAAPGQAGQAPQQQQPGIIQGAQRRPVTSFNLDPARLGFVQPMQQADPRQGGNPGQVEF